MVLPRSLGGTWPAEDQPAGGRVPDVRGLRAHALAVVADELENDATLLLGQHADVVASLSWAWLQTPGSEQDLRAFFRHLRSLLGSTKKYVYECDMKLDEVTRRARQEVEQYRAAATAARHVSERSQGELQELLEALERERTDRVWERAKLRAEVAEAEQKIARASRFAQANQTHSQKVESAYAHQAEFAYHDQHALRADVDRCNAQIALLTAELAASRRLLADRDSQSVAFQAQLRTSQQLHAAAKSNAELELIDSCVGRTLQYRGTQSANVSSQAPHAPWTVANQWSPKH